MCSSFASYTHPGKEEVHRQTSCGGGGSRLWFTFKDFKTLDVHSTANIEILAENKQVVHDGVSLGTKFIGEK